MEPKTKKIDGITDLRTDLIDYYVNAREGKVNVKEIGHISQLAGKIINSAKIELQYNMYLQTKKKIPFLEK
jgi:hypothetical protein